MEPGQDSVGLVEGLYLLRDNEAMHPTEVSRALAATTTDASARGLHVDVASVLQNSNRLAVRLAPCGVLARVALLGRETHDGAAFEVDMAQRLEAAQCPVGVLEPRVEPLVHVRDVFAITYWTYYDSLPAADAVPAEYAQVLARLHAGMRALDAPAPHFTDRIEAAHATVRDHGQSPDLLDADRELLTQALRSLRRAVVDRTADEQLLHGEPHAGNLLSTTSGMRFIDLETCCYGPVEFDVAHAPDEVGNQYAGADPLLLRDCRILALAMVAAWRSDRDDHFPNGALVRDELLSKMREALDRHGIDLRH